VINNRDSGAVSAMQAGCCDVEKPNQSHRLTSRHFIILIRHTLVNTTSILAWQ